MTDPIDATWYDGTRARGTPVQVTLDGDTLGLHLPDGTRHAVASSRVRWPERTRHGQRVAQLLDGGSLLFANAATFDAWWRGQGHRDSWVVRAQQHWRATWASLAGILLLGAAGYVWGVPWVAAGVVAVMPAAMESAIGDAAMAELREGLFEPTATPPDVQALWRERMRQMLDRAYPEGPAPWQLHFVDGGRLGANALALPGGHIVVTDQMLERLEGADDALLGVLAHEHGHVRRRHGLHALVRFGIVSSASSVVLGDFSAVLAAVPAMVAQMGYSRDDEREADADAAFVLRATGRDPAAMVALFERMDRRQSADDEDDGEDEDGSAGLPIAFASHPADAERVRFFRDAARQPAPPALPR